MSVWFWALLIAIALIGWLLAYMIAQKPITNVQQLIQQRGRGLDLVPRPDLRLQRSPHRRRIQVDVVLGDEAQLHAPQPVDRRDRTGRLRQPRLRRQPRSPGGAAAKTHYDRRRNDGGRHTAARRNLFNRMIGCLQHCLTKRIRYDEATAFPASADRQLPVAA